MKTRVTRYALQIINLYSTFSYLRLVLSPPLPKLRPPAASLLFGEFLLVLDTESDLK